MKLVRISTLLTIASLTPITSCIGAELLMQNRSCAVRFDPATLAICLRSGSGPEVAVSKAQPDLGAVTDLRREAALAAWSLPERKVSVSLRLEGGTLQAHILAKEPGMFTFPLLSETAAVKGWILPLFEGVYVPRGDERWASFLKKQGPLNTTADLAMPFAGLDCGSFTVTCILTNPFNNRLEFQHGPDRSLEARVTHEFTRNHPVKEYGVVFELGANSLIEPARRYRQWLVDRGQFVSLRDKIRRTPEAAKLPGAAHIYLWGHELLDHSDMKDWKGLARVLQSQGDASAASPGRRVWTLLAPETREFIGKISKTQWPDRYMKGQVTEGLNRLLAQPDFYDEFSWRGVALDDPTRALLKRSRDKFTRADLCRLNSHLLWAALPRFFAQPDTWGNGTSPKMIEQLAAAGFDRLWLGSDGWEAFLERPETVADAKRAGFLIGPYDSYHSIHKPGEPDTWATAQFDASLYATGAIRNADGSLRRGFKQKGHLLSPAAARPYVEKRVARLMDAFHANSWFVDCDGFGDYFDDYSTNHPATQQSDMQSRISRLEWIRDTYGAVIGTEGCSAGVASAIHFADGVLTPVIGWGDPDLTDKRSPFYLGNYYPPDEPQVFFKPVPIKEEYRYIYFNPQFRLPLFEAVFHDSVVATHHWTFASLKARDEANTVELLELLYQVPPLYHLNLQEFQKRKARMLRHYRFFSPLHRETALLPLTDFRWLTPDGTVQRTVFGDQIELVANFGTESFTSGSATVLPRSILVTRRDGEESFPYTPSESP